MDHVVGPLHILLAEKEGRIWFNIICLKLYQFERTTWWCLFVPKYILESTLKYVMLKNIKKIMVSRNLRQAHLLEVGPPPNENSGIRETLSIASPPCRTPCRVFIHEVFSGPLGLHLSV